MHSLGGRFPGLGRVLGLNVSFSHRQTRASTSHCLAPIFLFGAVVGRLKEDLQSSVRRDGGVQNYERWIDESRHWRYAETHHSAPSPTPRIIRWLVSLGHWQGPLLDTTWHLTIFRGKFMCGLTADLQKSTIIGPRKTEVRTTFF